MPHKETELTEGYTIFHAGSNETSGWELVAAELERQCREAEKLFDVEYLSNAKIETDGGGAGRNMWFGFQCVVLKLKKGKK